MKRILNTLFLLGLCAGMWAQIAVQGTVVDDKGEPVIGASVVVRGTTEGTVTDIDGHFTLSVAQGAKLVVS